MKAWDTEQPGRSQKVLIMIIINIRSLSLLFSQAQQSRQKFLETHAAVQKEDTTQDGGKPH